MTQPKQFHWSLSVFCGVSQVLLLCSAWEASGVSVSSADLQMPCLLLRDKLPGFFAHAITLWGKKKNPAFTLNVAWR